MAGQSGQKKRPKYALVLWHSSKEDKFQYSILHCQDIPNQEQLYNPATLDLIPHMRKGAPPKEGWKKYLGSVLKLASMKIL